MTKSLLPNNWGYKNLLTYQKSDVIYRITYYFCHKYLRKGDRTIDQMVQAARSGKQNIVEGCAASVTSSKTEIHLINVAKASLRELLLDYEDYLHTRNYRVWEEKSIEVEAMRRLGREHNDAEYFMQLVEIRPPETIANMAIVLIKQAEYLLYRQLQSLAAKFEREGGFSEKMAKKRLEFRNNKK